MEIKERLINDLATENAQLRVTLMEARYEIERLNEELKKGGASDEKHDVQLPVGDTSL